MPDPHGAIGAVRLGGVGCLCFQQALALPREQVAAAAAAQAATALRRCHPLCRCPCALPRELGRTRPECRVLGNAEKWIAIVLRKQQATTGLTTGAFTRSDLLFVLAFLLREPFVLLLLSPQKLGIRARWWGRR